MEGVNRTGGKRKRPGRTVVEEEKFICETATMDLEIKSLEKSIRSLFRNPGLLSFSSSPSSPSNSVKLKRKALRVLKFYYN